MSVDAWLEDLERASLQDVETALSRAGLEEARRTALYTLRRESPWKVGSPRWKHATLVMARTVITAPLEWAAALLSTGSQVTWKHPYGVPGIAPLAAGLAQQHGLPLQSTSERSATKSADLVVAMGSDPTMQAIQTSGHLLAFGHRFSIAWMDTPTPELAAKLAYDIALYDTRGCFSPVAVFTPEPQALLPMLAQAMRDTQRTLPRGVLSAGEHARLRARRTLAGVLGESLAGDNWQVDLLPLARFQPAALPRSVVVHAAPTPERMLTALGDHRSQLSTVGTNTPIDGVSWRPLGQLQTPPIRRLHDGVDWLRVIREGP